MTTAETDENRRARLAAQVDIARDLFAFLPEPEDVLDDIDSKRIPIPREEKLLRPLVVAQAREIAPATEPGFLEPGILSISKEKGRFVAQVRWEEKAPRVARAVLIVRIAGEQWELPVRILHVDDRNVYLDLGTEDEVIEMLRGARQAITAAPDAIVDIDILLGTDDADPSPDQG